MYVYCKIYSLQSYLIFYIKIIKNYKKFINIFFLIQIEIQAQSSKIFSDTAASSNTIDSSNYEQIDIDLSPASDCLKNIETTNCQNVQTADCHKISDVTQSEISETEKGIIRYVSICFLLTKIVSILLSFLLFFSFNDLQIETI